MKKIAMILGTLLSSASFRAFSTAPATPAKTLQKIHGAVWPKSVDGKITKYQCMKWHGDCEKLAAQTADLVPNSHKSHLGAVNCEDSHKANLSKLVLTCNECHNFTIKKELK